MTETSSPENTAIDKAQRPITDDATFTEAYAELKKASPTLSTDNSDATNDKKRVIESNFYGYLQKRFGSAAEIKITPPNATHSVEHTIQDRALAASDAPDSIKTPEKLLAATRNGDLNKMALQRFIEGVPAVRGFTTDDAVNLVRGGEKAAETTAKFPKADPDVLKATAYTVLQLNRDGLKDTHPAFYEEHKNTDFKARAHDEVFGRVQDDRGYKTWEGQKRQAIIDRITTNPELVADLTKINAPVDINNPQDLKNFLDTRERVADKIGTIYGDVYGQKDFNADDIHVVYAPAEDMSDARANAWHSTVGVNNDEAVFIRENPVRALLTGKYNDPKSINQAGEFINTATEEFQHVTDGKHADQLVNGKLAEDHPAYRHASLIALNDINYVSGDDHFGYSRQFTERTAKQVASDVSMNVTFSLGSAFDEAAESKQDIPSTEPQSAPPQPSAQSTPAPTAPSGFQP